MTEQISRRGFIETAGVAAAAGLLTPMSKGASAAPTRPRSGPVVISSANGLAATEKAAAMIRDGADTLAAVIAGVNIIENDPNDQSVGYGGLPNEDGVVELDACVMHGPSCRAGAVAALRNIKTPSQVAKVVMERTDHILLVGEGALRFARAHGFEETNLLTEKSRKTWLKWKESHSRRDDWIAPKTPDDDDQSSTLSRFPFTHGTINCCAVNSSGDLSGVTTTSGLSYKIPGRVGDSPIIGAGLFVDNAVGAAGSTGRGEAVLKICGSHTVIEGMRHGLSPEAACLAALKRIVDTTTETRLRRTNGRPKFNVKFYAVAKDGTFGAGAIWSGARFSVYADGVNRREKCAYLYQRQKD